MNSAKDVENMIAGWKSAGIDATQLVVNDANANRTDENGKKWWERDE